MKNQTLGCNETCNLNYGHEGEHNCGAKHKCNNFCILKDKSNGCEIKCSLEYPHEGKEHKCSAKHTCMKICQYINITIGFSHIKFSLRKVFLSNFYFKNIKFLLQFISLTKSSFHNKI